ncbi:MAG: hypothetical protein K8S55_12380, partial [Phycisphaerae bacterium]|nr:hypothetical protein [Phycisphaerae bacterium]
KVKANIQNITTSEIKISVLIDQSQAAKALQAVHDAFELGGKPVKKRKTAKKKTAKKTAKKKTKTAKKTTRK